jgi:hypothetical protein
MRAMQLVSPRAPLRETELALPEPGAEQVLSCRWSPDIKSAARCSRKVYDALLCSPYLSCIKYAALVARE